MEVYISINGVLRNLIQKFEYHYENNFLESDVEIIEDTEPFDYRVTRPICNDNLLNYFSFQSNEELNNFLFIDYPLEIFGHAGISYMSVMSDLNKLIYENPNINFTVIGLDEFGKAKSSTLFFLSKYSYLGNNVKFITSMDISKEWKKCDLWVTDNKEIINKCPKNKKAVKFVTEYNEFFTHKYEIKNLSTCLKFWEKTTMSTWIGSLKYAVPFIHRHQKRQLNQMKNNQSN
jgi:hypothetical protein